MYQGFLFFYVLEIFPGYPTPKLICHQNMFIEIPSHQDAVELKIPKPKTDVNWIRDITVIPSWAKSEKLSLYEGILNITFTAKHPISKLKVSCSTTITTLGNVKSFSNTFTLNLFVN